METGLVLVLCALGLGSVWYAVRSEAIEKFRMEIAEMVLLRITGYIREWGEDEMYREYDEVMESFIYKHSHAEMLFSFKPLSVEYWFDDAELALLGGCASKRDIARLLQAVRSGE